MTTDCLQDLPLEGHDRQLFGCVGRWLLDLGRMCLGFDLRFGGSGYLAAESVRGLSRAIKVRQRPIGGSNPSGLIERGKKASPTLSVAHYTHDLSPDPNGLAI